MLQSFSGSINCPFNSVNKVSCPHLLLSSLLVVWHNYILFKFVTFGTPHLETISVPIMSTRWNLFVVPAKVNKLAVTLRAALNPADFRLDNSPQRLSNSCPSPRAGSQSMVVSCLGGGPGWLSTLPLFPSWRSPSLTSERAGLPAYELMSLLTSMSKITSSMSGKVNILYPSTEIVNSWFFCYQRFWESNTLCRVSRCLYNLSFFACRAAKAWCLLSDHGEAQPGLWHALRPPPALLGADRCGVRERLRGAGYARWKRTRHWRRCAYINPCKYTHIHTRRASFLSQ